MKPLKGAALAALVAAASFAWAQVPAATAGSARSWLAANKASPKFAERLIEAAGAEEDLGRALLLVKDFEPYLKDSGDRFRTSLLAASYAEAGGLPHEAARWYEKALAADPGQRGGEIDFRLAVCRLKAGYAEDSLALAERLSAGADPAIAARARILSVWALAALGKRAEALSRADGLASSFARAELSDSSRYAESARYAAAYLRGSARTGAEERGSRDNPDALLLAGLSGGKSASGGVSVLDEPVYYLSGISASESVKATSEPASLGSPAPIASPSPVTAAGTVDSPPDASPARRIAGYLQAGAFSKKENAESLLKRLKEAGHEAAIRERGSASGKTLYYVVLPRDGEGRPSAAALKKAGFETVPYPYD